MNLNIQTIQQLVASSRNIVKGIQRNIKNYQRTLGDNDATSEEIAYAQASLQTANERLLKAQATLAEQEKQLKAEQNN